MTNIEGFICGCLVYICIMLGFFAALLLKIIVNQEKNKQEKI